MHILKQFIFIVLCVAHFAGFAQKPQALRHVRVNDQRETYGYTIMYGQFVQVLGSKLNGSVPQGICVYNIDSARYFSFDVSPSSSKENFFRCYVPAGRYAIVMYKHGPGNWESDIAHFDDVSKADGRIANSHREGITSVDELNDKYQFYIAPDTATYVGVWHFDSVNVTFTDNKKQQDYIEEFVTLRKKLDLTNSLISIPE